MGKILLPSKFHAAILLLFLFIASSNHNAHAWKLESGAVTTNDTFSTTTFTPVNFLELFDTTPVVVALATNQGGDSAALRIRNVTTSGFEISVVESPGEDGPHVSMDIHYIAMEPGINVLPTGELVVAGLHTTNTVQRQSNVGGPSGWDTINFGVTLSSTATLIAALQTMNSESGTPPSSTSQPFLSVAVRNLSATNAQLAIERSEVTLGSVSNETIGYIAFPSNTNGSFNDISNTFTQWRASTSADNIVGWDNACRTHTFSATAFSSARVVATKNSRDGSDGGWLRRCSLTSTTIGLQVDEDVSNDSERAHTTESVGVLAFSRSFHANFQGQLEVDKTVSIVNAPTNAPGKLFALPGATARYNLLIRSSGNLPIDNNALTFIDPIPANTGLVVTDIGATGSGPIRFKDGSPSSGLTYNFASLASTTDDISFSNDGGSTFSYTPTVDASGTDLAVTHIRVTPQGSFAPNNTSFEIEFDVIIQ